MADPTSDTPTPNTPEDVRPRATIKLKPMTPPTPAADAAAPAGAAADAASDAAAQAEPAIHITPSPASVVPGVKQTIRLRPPTPPTVESAPATEVKPAIKIVPKAAETPTGIPTAKPVESTPSTIQLKKPESSTPTIQLKKPESSTPTIQLKKPESSASTIQLKKPESSTPTVQLKKPEQESSPASAQTVKKVGESPIPPERKLTLKLKNQPSQPKELPKNIIPGLNIPNMPPQAQKPEEQKPAEAAQQAEQTPVAAPVETPTPVPEAVPEDKKKKGKLPKVKKQKDPVTSADEPNWFFLTLSILTLICVCFIAYLLFAQYMNMYQGQQIPIPQFLMPK
jgi:hypothetical protein